MIFCSKIKHLFIAILFIYLCFYKSKCLHQLPYSVRSNTIKHLLTFDYTMVEGNFKTTMNTFNPVCRLE